MVIMLSIQRKFSARWRRMRALPHQRRADSGASLANCRFIGTRFILQIYRMKRCLIYEICSGAKFICSLTLYRLFICSLALFRKFIASSAVSLFLKFVQELSNLLRQLLSQIDAAGLDARHQLLALEQQE